MEVVGTDKQSEPAEARCVSHCQAKLETEWQTPETQRSPPGWGIRATENAQVTPLPDFCFCETVIFVKENFSESILFTSLCLLA